MNRIINIGNSSNDTLGVGQAENRCPSSDSTELNTYRLFSISEVARMLGVGKDTIYNLLQTGQLGFIVIGKRKKIPVIEVKNFITKHTRYQTTVVNSNGFDDAFVKRNIPTLNNKVTKSIDAKKILEQIRRKK